MIFRCVSNKNARGKLSKTEVVQFWNVRSFGLFLRRFAPFLHFVYHFLLHLLLVFLAKSEDHKWRPKALSYWEELLEKQAKEERPWDFWPPELRSARPLFGNKTPLTPAKPGVLFCLGNYATVYHFQRHFFGSEKLPVSSIRSLRVFTPLCGF